MFLMNQVNNLIVAHCIDKEAEYCEIEHFTESLKGTVHIIVIRTPGIHKNTHNSSQLLSNKRIY